MEQSSAVYHVSGGILTRVAFVAFGKRQRVAIVSSAGNPE